jgi:hypothetical protein
MDDVALLDPAPAAGTTFGSGRPIRSPLPGRCDAAAAGEEFSLAAGPITAFDVLVAEHMGCIVEQVADIQLDHAGVAVRRLRAVFVDRDLMCGKHETNAEPAASLSRCAVPHQAGTGGTIHYVRVPMARRGDTLDAVLHTLEGQGLSASEIAFIRNGASGCVLLLTRPCLGSDVKRFLPLLGTHNRPFVAPVWVTKGRVLSLPVRRLLAGGPHPPDYDPQPVPPGHRGRWPTRVSPCSWPT